MMDRDEMRRIRAIYGDLRRDHATPYPTRFCWSRSSLDFGVCWIDTAARLITVTVSNHRCADFDVALYALLEEYAHAMTHRHSRVERHRIDEHDDEWSLAYGRLRRWYERRAEGDT